MGRPRHDGDVPRQSAGIVLYRLVRGQLEILAVHPGGPYWASRDENAWSIPKGEIDPGHEPLAVAEREFSEELGSPPPDGPRLPLGEVVQAGGKRVVAWAVAGDLDPAGVRSNDVEIEWPPRSGRRTRFPEVDRAEWLTLDRARRKLVRAQAAFLDRLADMAI